MNDLLSKFLTLLRNDVVILQRLFKKQVDETATLSRGISALADEVKKQKAPVINVPPIKVDIKTPVVNVPEIKVPDVHVPEIKIPDVKFTVPPITLPKPEVTVNMPAVKVPKPEVTVNVPTPKFDVKVPKEMTVEGFKEFARQIIALLSAEGPQQYDRGNPMPVILMDKEGKPYRAGGGTTVMSGGGGSGSDDPLEKFKISDIDDASNPKYYGFIDRDGHWYILKEDTTAKTYRYAAGPIDYSTNWTGRAALTYDLFNNVF